MVAQLILYSVCAHSGWWAVDCCLDRSTSSIISPDSWLPSHHARRTSHRRKKLRLRASVAYSGTPL